ncbi:hypothetical protein [Moorella sp. E308F]|jgi:hypothetical protein|nr:hypothetical protein [Moorella sp. E308F]
MVAGRAKMTIVAARLFLTKKPEVPKGREIFMGFAGSYGRRAKVIVVAVMVCGSRKVVAGYAGSCSSRS